MFDHVNEIFKYVRVMSSAPLKIFNFLASTFTVKHSNS